MLFHGHGGDADGYLSRFAYSNELGRGYFLVVNAFNSSALGRMRAEVERFLLAGFETGKAPPELPLTGEAYRWLEGEYVVRTRRFGHGPLAEDRRTVRLRAGRLRYEAGARWAERIGVAAGPGYVTLRRPGENRATAIAFRGLTGKSRLVDGDLNLERIAPVPVLK